MTKAWQRAKEIAGLLPNNVQWYFSITDIEDDVVFNIYAPMDAWHPLYVLLDIGRSPVCSYRNHDGRFPSFDEYNVDGLTLSFITPEEQHEHGTDEPR